MKKDACHQHAYVISFSDSAKYAYFLFNAFDKDQNGSLSFEVRVFNIFEITKA